MLTYKEYINITKRILRKMTTKNPEVGYINFKSDDLIADCISAVMQADWKWNPDKGMKLTVYRYQRVKWVVLDYTKENAKKQKNTCKFNNYSTERKNQEEYERRLLAMKEEPPELDMEELLSVMPEALTRIQRIYITAKYLENKPTSQIAQENQVSHSTVNQTIQSGIKALRPYESQLLAG